MKILLLGDVSPTAVTAPLFEAGDIKTLFGDTVSLFEKADYSFVNLECALTESDGKIKKCGPNLKAPLNTAKVLSELGVNLCGLSNNHIFDYGKKGVADTVNALDSAGIAHTGYGKDYEDSRKNFVLEKNGEKITFITVCEHEYSYALEDREGARPYDEYDTFEDIRSAKADSDRVIVLYHGGKEHCKYPSPRLLKLCRAMIKNGADIVIGQHSHCISTYENFENGHILHGQGNFHFVKESSKKSWYSSLAVMYDTVSGDVEFTPISMCSNGIRLSNDSEKAEIMSAFEKRCEELKTGEWKKGWHDFCLSVKKPYERVVKIALIQNIKPKYNEMFKHYIDCEAHKDVLFELYPTYNKTNEK